MLPVNFVPVVSFVLSRHCGSLNCSAGFLHITVAFGKTVANSICGCTKYTVINKIHVRLLHG